MSERIAILVIHGIGEEQPYGTLDAFTRGLLDQVDHCGKWTITPSMTQEPDLVRPGQTFARVAYHLKPPHPIAFDSESIWSARFKEACRDSHPVESTDEEVAIFEYYWAPMTKNKVKYTTSLLFLIKAGLQPFRYLASNVAAISTAAGASKRGRSGPSDKPYQVLFREILRQTLLFLPLLILFGSLLYFLSTAGPLKSLGDKHVSAAAVVTATFLLVRYLYIYTSCRALMQPAWRNKGLEATLGWKMLMVSGILFHLLLWPIALRPLLLGIASLGEWLSMTIPIPHLLATHVQLDWPSAIRLYAEGTLQPLFSRDFISVFFLLSTCLVPYLGYILFFLLAYVVRHILINYVGDIAVYANPNQLSQNSAAREQILDGSTAALAGILKQTVLQDDGTIRPRYDRVLLAGHSLGSVIAYDSLNGLLSLARTGKGISADDLLRLRGLVTFGSPLNKIYYFFRELDDPGATLRHRTLDLLHSFRLKSSLATNLPPVFTPRPDWEKFYAALRQGFIWINAYSLADPVSGRLLFYEVGREDPDRPGEFVTSGAQERLKIGAFGFAHLGYWTSQKSYRFLVSNLL